MFIYRIIRYPFATLVLGSHLQLGPLDQWSRLKINEVCSSTLHILTLMTFIIHVLMWWIMNMAVDNSFFFAFYSSFIFFTFPFFTKNTITNKLAGAFFRNVDILIKRDWSIKKSMKKHPVEEVVTCVVWNKTSATCEWPGGLKLQLKKTRKKVTKCNSSVRPFDLISTLAGPPHPLFPCTHWNHIGLLTVHEDFQVIH